jgi:Rrf2 family transcriptional regulator, cysteine metabolism repressor
MTLLSRKADYALLILSYLHQRAEGGNARAIAERFNLSRPFVANILKELCHKGFVASHRGVNGGYTLQKPADRITLAELLDAIGEGFRLTLCSHPAPDEDPCSLEAECPVKGPLADIHRRIVAVLTGVTLADVFSPPTVDSPVVPLGLLPVLQMSEPTGCCSSRRPEPAAVMSN